jgi:RHS repeat-associated protein
MIGEYDYGANITVQETVWLGDMPVAVLKNGQTHFVHTDHLNTPRAIKCASTQQTVWRWAGEPFGTSPAEEDVDGDGVAFEYNLRFAGQYLDKETGLHQNWNRDYAPGVGRYTQSDPIGLAGGFNTYGYVFGNPISFHDPYGLFCISNPARDAISNGIGTAAGAAAQGLPLPLALASGAVAGAVTYVGGETAGGTVAGAVQGFGASRSVHGTLAGAAGGLIAGADGGTVGGILGGAYQGVLEPTSRMGRLNPNGWNAVAGPVMRGAWGGLVTGLVTAGIKEAIDLANSNLGDCNCGK